VGPAVSLSDEQRLVDVHEAMDDLQHHPETGLGSSFRKLRGAPTAAC
jgi:hypothetical protein